MSDELVSRLGGAVRGSQDACEALRACLAEITPDVHFAVNAGLTFGRRRRRRSCRPVEATDFARMMRRMIRAHGRRVADADVEDLADLVALRDVLEEAITFAVVESRARHGRSWADIARGLCGRENPDGVTRQAAQQRYGKVAR